MVKTENKIKGIVERTILKFKLINPIKNINTKSNPMPPIPI